MTNKTVEVPFGFLIIDKAAGLTSHDCVQKVRKIFGIRRVGHGGTLDPNVTGVLPIAIGNATRLIPYLEGSKTYYGTIQLGKKTTTDDISGSTISQSDIPDLSKIKLEKYLDNFRGIIDQQPPQVSSIKINGERAYKRHRRGEDFTIASRKVEIYDLKLIKFNNCSGIVEIIVDCSSGTYIRSLARDLGEIIGCGGCLINLRRLQALGFTEKQAIKLPDENNYGLVNKTSIINPIDALKHLDKINLCTEEEISYWSNGRSINCPLERLEGIQSKKKLHELPLSKSLVAIHLNETLIGIGEWEYPSVLHPKIVFNPKQ